MKAWNAFGVALLILGSADLLAAQEVAPPGRLASASEIAIPAMAIPSGTSASAMPAKLSLVPVEEKHDHRMKTIWISSLVAMGAATSADAVSSWHKQEANGLLASSNGTFGAKGVSLKAGIAAGVLLPQIIFRKHKELRSTFAIGNFAEAGVFTGTAIHNFRIAAPK